MGEDVGLIAGHARILAARQLGIAEIPVPEPIPLFLFAEAREDFGEPLTALLVEDEQLDEAMAALRTFALVDCETIIDERDPAITTDTIRLHRLVREIAAARRAGEAREDSSERFVDHQWLISNGKHSPRGFGHPLLSLRTWETYAFRRSQTMVCRPGKSARRKENGANGTSSRKVLPTPSRRPKRRRSSKRKQHRGCHDVGVTGMSDARREKAAAKNALATEAPAKASEATSLIRGLAMMPARRRLPRSPDRRRHQLPRSGKQS